MRSILLFLAFAVLCSILLAHLLSRGEVVTLVSRDDHGVGYRTSLWIIDEEDVAYLRSGRPDSSWLARIRERPHVELIRTGVTQEYTAVPLWDDRVRTQVNRRMARKYGLANQVIGWLIDLEQAVPVRLEARTPGFPQDAGDHQDAGEYP